MTEPRSLTAVETDALREAANIGSGHAATALSQLTGMSVMIDIPEIAVVPATEVPRRIAGATERVVTLSMRTLGEITGHTLFVMQEGNAARLCDVLLHRPPGSSTVQGELERSSLMETGNIMAGSFLNALSALLGKLLLPSVPTVSVDASDAVGTNGPASVLVVESNFLFERSDVALEPLRGVFLFVLDDDAPLRALFDAVQPA